MRITKWVDFGQDVDVNIDADDIHGALVEAFKNTERNLDEVPGIPDILRALNSIGAYLNAFQDEDVARLNDAQRNTIAGYLATASAKFAVKVAAPTTEAGAHERGRRIK